MRSRLIDVFGVSVALAAVSCGADSGPQEEETGSLTLRVELSDVLHDVTAVRLDVVAADQDCSSEPLFTQTVSFSDDSFPGAETRPYASAIFVLSAGAYRVCAAPLVGDGPSAECGTTDGFAEVASGTTTEVMLTSQCGGEENGGLGVVVTLNDRPEIEQVVLDPSGFISVCESVELAAVASDPNEDELVYTWSVLSGPDGGSLHPDGERATFSGQPGDYGLLLDVSDGHGGATSLSFPIHVADAVCEVPAAVQAIFTQRCSPCHTTGSSGGLHLDPASASFGNLVNVHASSAACATRTRVIPGDSASSYLIAKLLGEAGICGQRMPRNAPPLPDEEVATIAAWIDGLPH